MEKDSSPRSGGDDVVIPFQIEGTPVRGRIVRLGPAIDAILAAHGFPASVSEAVGEMAALAALMGSALKFDGRLTVQAHGEGPVRMLVADFISDGALRATATLSGGDAKRGLRTLLGAGHFAVTIDQGAEMERYQGVTPLAGDTLAAAASSYFAQSEQIPTAIRLAVARLETGDARPVWRAGGIMIQLVPPEGGARGERNASESDLDCWDRAAALLATTQADELVDPMLGAEDLLFRLYHEDGARVFAPRPVVARCSCNAGKIEAVLERYAVDDLAEMARDGRIEVVCDFCRTAYLFDSTGRPLDIA